MLSRIKMHSGFPKSAINELLRHADLFLRTACWLHARHPGLHFVAPFADAETRTVFEQAWQRLGATQLDLTLLTHRSREALAASDLALLASGTATLEAALFQKPMVVTYRLSTLSYLLIRLLSHVTCYSLPNNLAGRALVPEFIQSDAVPEKLGQALERYLLHPEQTAPIVQALGEIRQTLRRNSNERAAEAVLELLRSGRQARRTAQDPVGAARDTTSGHVR